MKLQLKSIDRGLIKSELINEEGKLIGTIHVPENADTIELEEAEANAKFIVTAVNSHEELKEALIKILNIDQFDYLDKFSNWDKENIKKVKEIAKQALKNCE